MAKRNMGGRPPLAAHDRKRIHVATVVTAETRERIDAACDKVNLCISEFVFDCINRRLKQLDC
jgi:hypothetical protein